MAPLNSVKSRLAAGDCVVGTWILTVRTPAIVKMAARAGFDYVAIDAEHSSLSVETIGDMCDVARSCGIVPIVRPAEASHALANRLQDVGAMGLMFPDVVEPDVVAAIGDWMMYPPRGSRGHTSGGATFDYEMVSDPASKDRVDAATMIIVQVESRQAVERIDELLEAGPIDVIEIGGGDLSTSYGVPFQTRHQSVLKAVDVVIDACRRHGVAPGMMCSSVADAEQLLDRGVRFVTVSSDRTMLMRAFLDATSGVRAAVAARTVRYPPVR